MVDIMYKHCDINDKFISLHDCRVTKVLYDKGILTFIFNEGFYICKDHPDNKINKIVLTDKAEVRFNLVCDGLEDVTIYVFKEKIKKTIREEWDLSRLMEYINDKGCTLEILYRYDRYNSIIIECCLWSKKKPYHRECELRLSLKDEKYCWNELCEECEW